MHIQELGLLTAQFSPPVPGFLVCSVGIALSVRVKLFCVIFLVEIRCFFGAHPTVGTHTFSEGDLVHSPSLWARFSVGGWAFANKNDF